MDMLQDDELLASFVEDSLEHLDTIESELMDLEEAGEAFDDELVNSIFRTAHSIKGSSRFLGLDKIGELSHKLENALSLVRDRELSPDHAVCEALLSNFDVLTRMVRDSTNSNEVDISAHVAELTALMGAQAQEESETIAPVSAPGIQVVFEVDELTMRQAAGGGHFLYVAEYDLIHDVHHNGLTPLGLINELEKSGLIVDSKLDITAVGTLEGGISPRIPFYVLYASILDNDLITAVMRLPRERVAPLAQEQYAAVAGPVAGMDAVESETTQDTTPAPEFVELEAHDIGTMRLSPRGGTAHIHLGPTATDDQTPDVRFLVSHAVKAAAPVHLDGTELVAVDAAMLQTLISARLECQRHGLWCTLDMNDAGRTHARRLGLHDFLPTCEETCP